MNLVKGVGVSTEGRYPRSIKMYKKSARSKEYYLWQRMLTRSYCADFKIKHPSYQDCVVSEGFKNFQYFAEWCNNQIGFKLDKYELDKDILCGETKIYSENTCVFIPQELNKFLTLRQNRRGDYPLGVRYIEKYKVFSSYININGQRVRLGQSGTVEDAFLKYKVAKEAHAKHLADKYTGAVDSRVIAKLREFTVSIHD